ncbi:MAG: hypothetical protein LQ338_001096 [Usnochroma carphineum]|nr:MAG: hypothetical protein LQ338_001096 [Usnochroma carphineum]
MFAEMVQIFILRSDELLAKKFPGMLPSRSLLRKDAMTKLAWLIVNVFDRQEVNTFESCREDDLEILWIEDMKRARSEQQVLRKHIPRLISVRDRA